MWRIVTGDPRFEVTSPHPLTGEAVRLLPEPYVDIKILRYLESREDY